MVNSRATAWSPTSSGTTRLGIKTGILTDNTVTTTIWQRPKNKRKDEEKKHGRVRRLFPDLAEVPSGVDSDVVQNLRCPRQDVLGEGLEAAPGGGELSLGLVEFRRKFPLLLLAIPLQSGSSDSSGVRCGFEVGVP